MNGKAERTAFVLKHHGEPEMALAVREAAASHKFRKTIWVIFEGRDCRANKGQGRATWPPTHARLALPPHNLLIAPPGAR